LGFGLEPSLTIDVGNCPVDLVNKLGDVAEDRDAVPSRIREKVKDMDLKKFSRAVSLFGK
jgi:hypothetical protein